jgi:hypothetical protein
VPDAGPGMLLAILLGSTGAAYVAVTMPGAYRVTLAVAIGLNLIVLAMKWPTTAALTTLLFLPFVALIRRLLITSVPYTANDPLILIGPVVALFLFYRLYILEDRRLTSDLISKLALGLVVLGLIEVLNPFGHGTLPSNVGGLIFLAVPLLWFFIGREIGEDRSIAFLLQAIIVVAVAVGLYGLFQTEWSPGQHLPSWDQRWFDVAGYGALVVTENAGANNAIRAFSTFPSNQEYATFLAVSLVAIFAMVLHRRFWPLALAPFLAIAMFWAGGRSPMALAGFAAVVLAGVRSRNAINATIIVVLGIGAIFGLATLVGPRLDRAAGVNDNAIATHNIRGLLHPLSPDGSGLGRWTNFTTGISHGFSNPAGLGTGESNAAGGRLSNDSKGTQDTDNDISDVFVSYGLVGGVTFMVLIVLVFRGVFREYARTGSWVVFATLGILVCMFGNWLNGGYYTLAPLMWFLAGWATRPDRGGAPAEQALE